MNVTRSPRSLLSLVGCCLLFLLAACGTTGTPPTTNGQTPTTSATSGTTPAGSTVAVPPTQTTCPAAGTARAAVMTSLAPGNHQNLVYLVTEFHGNTPTSTLKRYDVVTGNKTEVLKLAGVSIDEAQVSADGQWLLFVATLNQQQKLQLVRMDGKGLQTLYCASNRGIQNVLWSANQHLVLFSGGFNNQNVLSFYLLNLQSGTIQVVLQSSSGPRFATPLTWLDNTRAYVSLASFSGPSPLDSLGLLDTSRGPNQQVSNLTIVFHDQTSRAFNYPCWDADSSYDGSTLFTVQCSGISAPNCSGACVLGTRDGPSTISTEPAAGGPEHSILVNARLGIAAVRAISNSTLLLQVENFSMHQLHPVDSSQNGLWKVNTDGTGLTRLTTEARGDSTSLCPFTQNPWSNVSRNGVLYAFETNTTGTYPYTYRLFFGPLNGGAPISFAAISDGTQLTIVGWTTM